ncbi:hypothetical protein V6D40_09365 [Corynebacterium sp. Q4381]|uniref:hypothetical protein n=1 Tax=Corynebacterium sp. Marseille-Q4381 TaxID=3121597 RepID=UPI002FE58DD9
MTIRSRSLTTAATAAIAGTLVLAPAAQADLIDDALAKLPAGQIPCSQASKYWTNEADYNSKVRQAQTVARFDSRGPQILEALGRVDEAANRCGLKGGGNAPARQNPPAQPAQQAQQAQRQNQQAAQQAPAQQDRQAQQAQQAPAPAQQAPAGQRIQLAPAGVPSFEVPVGGVGTVVLPDVLTLLRQALAEILNFFNVKVPGIN